MTAAKPEDPLEAGLRAAEKARAAGDAAGARCLLSDLVQKMPDNHRPRIALAEVLLAAGQCDDAIAQLEAAQHLVPGNGWVAIRRAQALRRAGQPARAQAAIAGFMPRADAATALGAGLLLEHAACRAALGDHTAARTATEAVIAARPDDRRGYGARYWQAHGRGDHAGMLAAAEAMLDRWPADRPMQLARGRHLRALGRHQAAVAWLRTLAAEDPADTEISREYAATLAATGDGAAAAAVLASLLDHPSAGLHARRRLTDLALAEGDHAGVRALCLPALQAADGGLRGDADSALCLAFLAAGPEKPGPGAAGSCPRSCPDSCATAFADACLGALLARVEDLDPWQLWRLVRGAEIWGDRDKARRAMQALLRRQPLPAPVARRLLARLAASAPQDAGQTRALAAWLGTRVPVTDRADLAIEAARLTQGHAAALRLMRLTHGTPDHRTPPRRTPAQAVSLAQLLTGAGRARLGWRYLRRCLRQWPEVPALRSACADAARQAGCGHEALALIRHLAATHGADAQSGPMAEIEADLLQATGDAAGALTLLDRLPDAGRPRLLVRRITLAIEANDSAAIARLEAERADLVAKAPGRHGPHALGGFALAAWHQEQRCLMAAGAGDATLAADLLGPARGVIAQWLAGLRPSAPAVVSRTPHPIPRQIMQYWHAADLPPEVAGHMASWRAAAGFVHQRLDRRGAMAFLRKELGADWAKAFGVARDGAAACDLLRLAWLALRGGVYADADDRLTSDLTALVHRAEATGLLLYREARGVIANNLIIARPGHPLIARAAVAARDALLRREWDDAWSATGPGLITRMLARYVLECPDKAGPRDLCVIPEAEMRRKVQTHLPLVYKATPAYWANRDKPIDDDYRDLLTAAMRVG